MTKRSQLTADHIQTASEAYKYTLKRTKVLKQSGYIVEEMWECDFHKQLKDDPEMKAFVDAIKIMAPLDPRDGKNYLLKFIHFLKLIFI